MKTGRNGHIHKWYKGLTFYPKVSSDVQGLTSLRFIQVLPYSRNNHTFTLSSLHADLCICCRRIRWSRSSAWFPSMLATNCGGHDGSMERSFSIISPPSRPSSALANRRDLFHHMASLTIVIRARFLLIFWSGKLQDSPKEAGISSRN